MTSTVQQYDESLSNHRLQRLNLCRQPVLYPQWLYERTSTIMYKNQLTIIVLYESYELLNALDEYMTVSD